ncbi:MAG: ABC transporter ATP-binding protein [Cypionkella sp.]|uniref:ABC transporter ATP-binding protein n=1 Tax=Cypionkella sp. TaxID=2811411 RepID=UPI002ABAF62B|nr:ABC transporter ATP-binding protein [Cypionkella sp.]MDZ4311230.1 ABC transporter ATP-binding protein [Cypionkella sp.]
MPFDVQDLTLRLGDTTVLNGINCRLPEGGITGIIGANGSGKTTLLRCLAGVLRPQSGRVYHAGSDIAQLAPKTRARRIALLPQTALAPAGLTVQQLVARGRTPWLRPFQPMTHGDHAAVARALTDVGMTDLAARPLDSLSGGQRQRAWIALVLAQDTGTVLLDEPLNFLDLPHQTELVHLLRRLASVRSVVMILHDLTIAARVCDHVLALKAGQLVASGPPAEVLAEAPLRAAFGIDFECLSLPGSGKPVVLPQGL